MRQTIIHSLFLLLTASCSENFEVRPNSELESNSGGDNYVATEDGDGKVSSKIYLPEGIDANGDNADLQKGATIPGDVTAAYLTIPGKLNQRSESIYVAIKDEVEEFVVGSAIISINLDPEEDTALALKSDAKTLIVLYHIEKSGSFFFGAIPTNDLDISDDEVSFTVAGEGNYQIFDIDIPLDKPVSKVTNTPPLSHSELSNESGDADSTHFKRDFECPENFVYVKENLTPGLGGNPDGVNAFCVSKYEMRQKNSSGLNFSLTYFSDGSGGSGDGDGHGAGDPLLLESTPHGVPLTIRRESIDYAEKGCNEMGAGYSIINSRVGCDGARHCGKPLQSFHLQRDRPCYSSAWNIFQYWRIRRS